MKWYFVLQCEQQGRMQTRVLQVLDSQLLALHSYSMTQLDGRIVMRFIVDADERQAHRVECLLRKIHGMVSVDSRAQTGTLQPFVALGNSYGAGDELDASGDEETFPSLRPPLSH